MTPIPDIERPSSISTTTAQMIDLSKLQRERTTTTLRPSARLERVDEVPGTSPGEGFDRMALPPKKQTNDLSLSMPAAISLTLSKTIKFITYESSQL